MQWSGLWRLVPRLRLLPALPSEHTTFAVAGSSVQSAEIGGGGCLDDLGEARLQNLPWEKACPNCVLDHSLNARIGCDESSPVCRSRDVSRSCVPYFRLACAERCLRHTVLRETREEPFERTVPNLVVDLCSTLFLQDCVAVNPLDVVDTANSQTLSLG